MKHLFWYFFIYEIEIVSLLITKKIESLIDYHLQSYRMLLYRLQVSDLKDNLIKS
jgi:hypothetical protein